MMANPVGKNNYKIILIFDRARTTDQNNYIHREWRTKLGKRSETFQRWRFRGKH